VRSDTTSTLTTGSVGSITIAAVGALVSEGSSAISTLATESSSNRSWLSLEGIGTLLTSTEVAALGFELAHADSWELGSSVVLGLVLVDLVDWDSGVDNRWLDSLLLDDWLDVLVDVVVNVLTSNGGACNGCVLNITNLAGVLELSSLSSETLLYVVVIAVLDVAVLNTGHLVGVLLWENLTILNWLDGGVVVILVDLTVDGSLSLINLSTGDALIGDSWVD